MITLRPVDYRDDDHDSCYNSAYAALEIHGTKILLCKSCLDDLIEEVKQFQNTVLCHQCVHFRMGSSGFDYGGSCLRKAREDGKVLIPDDFGVRYCVDSLYTCKDAQKAESGNGQQN